MSDDSRVLWIDARPKDDKAPIPQIACDGAAFVVTIDGKPYAGFVSRASAEMAVGMWSGALDGMGNPVPLYERARHGWAPARGRRLEVVERALRGGGQKADA